MRSLRRASLVAALVSACGGTVATSSAGGGGDGGATADAGLGDVAAHADAAEAAGTDAEAAVDAPADSGLCMASSDSTISGAWIAFRAPVACQFTLAQAQAGISIPYDVVVAQDVTGVVPTPQDAGHCGAPGPSGLIVSGSVTGGGQTYGCSSIGDAPGREFSA
jgi:hypothetical protein